jgi:hypothetical protein
MNRMLQFIFIIYLLINTIYCGSEEQEGVKYADKCEGLFLYLSIIEITILLLTYFLLFIVCKVVATELEARLDETGKTSDVLEIGYSIDDVIPKKRKEYKTS